MQLNYNYMFEELGDVKDCVKHFLDRSNDKEEVKKIFKFRHITIEEWLKDLFAEKFILITDIDKCSEIIYNLDYLGHNKLSIDIVKKRVIIYSYCRILIEHKGD